MMRREFKEASNAVKALILAHLELHRDYQVQAVAPELSVGAMPPGGLGQEAPPAMSPGQPQPEMMSA